MKLLTINFESPVQDPTNGLGVFKRAYSAPVGIDAQGELVTLTCPKTGATVITNVRWFGVPQIEAKPVPQPAPDAEPVTSIEKKSKKAP